MNLMFSAGKCYVYLKYNVIMNNYILDSYFYSNVFST